MKPKPDPLHLFATEVQKFMPTFLSAMLRQEQNAVSEGVITLPQFLGMNFLRANPGSPVKDFAATLGLKPSSASGLVDRMVNHGLIHREHSDTDRRVVLLTLTPKGKKMVEEVREQKRQSIAKLFASLTDDERATYLRLMQKVVGAIDEI